MGRADSLEKSLLLEKIESKRRRGQQRMRWLDGITTSMDVRLSNEQAPGDGEGQGSLVCCSPWGCKELDANENWTTTTHFSSLIPKMWVFNLAISCLTTSNLLWFKGLREWANGRPQGRAIGDSFSIDQNSKTRIAGQLRRLDSAETTYFSLGKSGDLSDHTCAEKTPWRPKRGHIQVPFW